MRFWDSSALVPLVVEEQRSASCRALLRSDSAVAVWAFTRVEVVAAVRRIARDNKVDDHSVSALLRRIESVSRRWTVIEPSAAVGELAERLVGVHPLTAADALQLAAAIIETDDRPRGQSFVTADLRLARAAEAEGFRTIVPHP